MSIIAGALTTGGLINKGLGLLNSGQCGKRCFGFGKSLRRCRDAREQACKQEKQLKEQQRLMAEEQERLRQLQASNNAQSKVGGAGSVGGFNLAGNNGIILVVLGAIFFIFNKSMKK